MNKTDSMIDRRAVDIAARIMQAAGVCRYENAQNCKKVYPPTEKECIGCIKRFLRGKAKYELKREGKL